MLETYIFKDGEIHKASTTAWGENFGNIDNRKIAYTDIDSNVNVSTVFLGLDHAWGGGSPVLFETMIFGLENEFQWRHCSFSDAKAFHGKVVDILRCGILDELYDLNPRG